MKNIIRWNFAAIAMGALLALGTGCADTGSDGPEPEPTDGGQPDVTPDECPAERDPCRRNIDCAAGAICEVAEGDEEGCCLQILCTDDSQCEENEFCDVRRGLCLPEGLCDPANPGEVCQPGELCQYSDGVPQCIPVGQAAIADVCDLGAGTVYVRDGDSVELSASGSTTAGALVPDANIVFTSDVGTVSGNSLTGTCAGPDACSGTITMNNGTADCGTGNIVVFPAVDAANFRVVVFDASTNEPVSATVALKLTGVDVLTTAETDANGVANFTGVPFATVEAASAFSTTHAWMTYMSPGTNDLAIFAAKNPNADRVAGVKGDINFDNVSTSGDIQLGLAGMAISPQITELDFATILGEIADYEINLDGVTQGPEIVPLPSGLVLGLADTEIKGNYVAFGEPGKNLLWALGGKVRLSEIGPIISSVTASDDISVGSILNSVLPFFATFDHGVVADLDLTEQDRPTPPADGTPVDYDAWPFDEKTINLNTLLSQGATYNVPDLPCAAGELSGATCARPTSGAILLSGVVVPGRGIVPLGLTAGLDDPTDTGMGDGVVTSEVDGLSDGQLLVDYAPPHDGLEGNTHITIGIALDIDGLTSGGLAASTITHITDGYGDTNNFPTNFLEHQGGTYDRAAGTFTHEAVGSADFYRLNLDDGGDGDWNIYFSSAANPIDVNALRPDTFTGRDQDLEIQAFTLGTGYTGATPANYGELIEFNGTDFDKLVYYMGGWASTTCSVPDAAENPDPFCDIAN